MRKHGKKWLAGIMAAVLAASLLTGCGNGDGENSTPAGTKETETTQEVETQGTTEAAAETTSAPAEESDLAVEIRGNTNPTPEQIELVNTTFDDSYLGEDFDAMGSDYSVYDGRFDGVTLDIWYHDPGGLSVIFPDLSEHPFFKKISEVTGIKLHFIIPATGEAGTEFNLLMSGQDLPDIIFNVGTYYQGGILVAEEDGVILNLSEYEDKLPNYMYCINNLPSSDLIKRDSIADNGHRLDVDTLYNPAGAISTGLIIKKRAMEDTGWTEVPETIDEWHTFLTDCKNAGYEIPFVCGNDSGFLGSSAGAFATAFGVMSGCFIKDDGTVAYGPAEPGLKDYLETMVQWYEEGLLDPDYISGDSAHRQQLIASEESAAMISVPDTVVSLVKGSTWDDFVAAPLPVMNKGDQPVANYSRQVVSTVAKASVSSQCENIDAALAFLDFCYTKKGCEIAVGGTYGDVHLVDEDGALYLPEDSLRYTDPEIQEHGGMWAWKYMAYAYPFVQAPLKFADPIRQANDQGMLEARELWTSAKLVGFPSGATLTAEESASIADISTNISTAQDEYLTKIVAGQLPVSEVDTFLETVRGMGLDQLLEVRQAAYDRYMAK